ncbi:MAG: gamma-glutamyltransferase family protein, partial [Pseudomonadales bacterium]
VALSERFGALPFGRLFEEAIRYAEEGFQVGPKTGFFWPQAVDSFKGFAPFMDTFTIDGQAPAIGERMRLPDHAKTLARVAETKGEAFYRGDLAKKIAADAAQHDAALTEEDLALHQCDWVEPISADGFGVTLHEIPPSGQGLMALIALGVAKRAGLGDLPLDSADSIHLQIEAMRIAYADMAQHLADIDAMRFPPEAFLEPAYLASRAKEISMAQANPQPYAMGAGADTVYLATADAGGMMVSMIQSNYMGFGSGIVIPGTGIAMQNRGAGFVLEEGHVNQLGPDKRPYHTIIPGFVTKDDAPLLSFGVMGGHMQAQGHLQMVVRVCLHGQNPQAASDALRWRLMEDGRVALEAGFDANIVAELEARGHHIVLGQPEYLFGGAQLIAKTENGYVAGSDHRKEGMAAGY